MTETAPQQPDSGARAEPDPPVGVPQVPSVQDLQVESDRVLQVATIVEEQADALQRLLEQRVNALRIPAPSDDTVSTHAVEGWNEVLADGQESYGQRVSSYVQQLHRLAEQLRAAGADYAATEEDHAAALHRHGPEN